MAAMRGRMRKEIAMLETDPPFGVSAWPKDGKIDELEAQILGPDDSPYEKGVFRLEIEIPERYPFEPPKVRFVTPIYHPNIDDAGRICLDTLKMQPKGSWMPSVNISTLLTTIRLLMAEPNADDGLMPEIADIFKHNRELFNRKAAEMTAQHARPTETRRDDVAVSVGESSSKGGSQAIEKHLEQKPLAAIALEKSVGVSLPKSAKSKRMNSFEEDSLSDGDSSSEDNVSDFESDDDAQTQDTKRQRRN